VNWLARILIVLFAGLPAAISAAAKPLPRSVLILEQNNPNAPAYVDFASRLQATLNASDAPSVDVYIETFDLYRFNSADYRELLRTYMANKYRNKPIGVIVPVGPLALEFELQWRAEIWPTVPIAFEGIDTESLAGLSLPPETTGDTENLTLSDEVNAARIMVPDLRQIAIVGDPFERQSTYKHFAQELPQIATDLHIIDLTGLPMAEAMKRVAALPPDSAIIYIGIHVDGAGKSYTARDGLVPIAEVANRPIVVTTETYFGYGATGGVMTSYGRMGDAAGRLVLRILNGESASEIPVDNNLATKLIFDWRQLQRWGISESRLPTGSEIRFRVPGIWEQYRWYVTIALVTIATQLGLIIWLMAERRRRQIVEANLLQRLAQVIHLNRSATAGALSASVAHELNQPLGAILSNAEAAELYLDAVPPNLSRVKAILGNIRRDDQRAADIVTHMRVLQKEKVENNSEEFDLHDAVNDTIEFIEPEAKKQGVTLNTDFVPGAQRIRADKIQLEQVILNLALNAMDAMKDTSSDAKKLSIKTALVGDSEVKVSVSDSGTGIPSDQLDKIFDTYFTTKPNGTGLGLSISRTIIENSGGKIWAENRARGGAVIRFTLPLLNRPPS